MERVTVLLVLLPLNIHIQSLPIENGFSVKFNPISPKEELKPKQFGALFAKIPQDFNKNEEIRREVLTRAYFPQKDVPSGFTNQVAKLLFPTKYFYDGNNSQSWSNVNVLNLPIIKQPYNDYKILVATAPPNVHIGGDKHKRTVIYVVFPDDGSTSTEVYNIPTVYFVNEKSSKLNPVKKGVVDPILIVDNNRTVTGLKSREISKFVRFNNKWTNRYNYKISR